MRQYNQVMGMICPSLLSAFSAFLFRFSLFFVSSIFILNSLLHASEDFLKSNLSESALIESIAQSHEWRSLLHFRSTKSLIGQDSGFFLSPHGAKDPQAELLATLHKLLSIETPHTLQKSSESKICTYPARAKYLSKFFPKLKKELENMRCVQYEEFLQIVPSDRISLIFAGESDVYPGSAMGHIFLALEGEAREDFYKKFEGRSDIDIKKGQYIGYSLGFFANTDLGLNPISYIRALIGNLNGIYALQPLDNNEFEYLENEKRSLWKLELRLDSEQKALLLAHLWELKDIPVDYAFITHNCNDALKIVLGVANKDFDIPKHKPYQTPTEYIKALYSARLITHTEVQNPESKQSFVKHYGQNDIFNMRDSAKISLFWSGGSFDQAAHLYFSPIYSDILNANSAYKEYIESRLFALEAEINIEQKSALLRQVEALHLFSINDTFRTKELAKYIDIAFQTPIWEREHTSLRPQVSFGLGVGSYVGNLSFYTMPILGYEYIKGHNAFLNIRVGALLRLPRIQLVGSYDYFLDFTQSLRGYEQKLNAQAGINLYKQIDFFIRGSFYPAFFDTQNLYSMGAGVSLNF